MYKSAKEMYFAYECNEYFMKTDDVLSEYKKYGVPTKQQELWKKEYIEMLFDTLMESNDTKAFSSLSRLAKENSNKDILERLLNYFLEANTKDVETKWRLSYALLNSISVFALERKDCTAIKILDIVENSFNQILSGSDVERWRNNAQKGLESVKRLKKHMPF